MSSRQLLLIAAAAALGACTMDGSIPKRIGQQDPFLGEAVKYNAAVQTINPDPVYPEGAMEPGSVGVKGSEAVERYRTNQVNERHRAETQQSTGLSTTSGSTGGPQ